MADNNILGGRRFAVDFIRIDKVKSNDKFLVADDSDGVVKYATPAQINARFEGLEADIETATNAVTAASAAQTAAETAKAEALTAKTASEAAQTGAESAKADALAAQSKAETAAENAQSSAENAAAQASAAVAGVQTQLTAESTTRADADEEMGAEIERIGADEALKHDYTEEPLLCGQPKLLLGAGTPSASVVPVNWNQYDPDTETGYNWVGMPSAVGQRYLDCKDGGGEYIATEKDIENPCGNLVWRSASTGRIAG